MIPRGNLTPWSFNKEKDLYRAESLAKLADSEKTAFDSKQVFAFDPDWDDVSPFVQGKDGFSLRVNLGSDTRILFPSFLNSRSPIKIRTGNKTVKQYLSSGGSYRGELVGRYLIYRGNGPDILYRFDTDSNELREFVYVPTRSSLKKEGEVIRWRFEGVNLSLQKNGSARLIHSKNPAESVIKFSKYNDTSTWKIYSKAETIDEIWEGLYFCMRDIGKGGVKDYENSPDKEVLENWTRYSTNKYRGALSVRYKSN